MIRRTPRSTRTYTLCSYTTLFRSVACIDAGDAACQMEDDLPADRLRCADSCRCAARNAMDQDRRACLVVGRRGADVDYRLGLSARRPETYGDRKSTSLNSSH